MDVTRTGQRLASIDMVKGWAIIGVTLIHSTVLGNSRWMTWGFFHAVPVFLVLFGLNSEQWFRRHTGRDQVSEWYARSVKRILIPAWATIAAWWVLVLALDPPIVRVTISLPFYHLIGYTKQIGMGWFVSVIIQLVVLFPIFHFLARRAGVWLVLAIGLVTTILILEYTIALKAALGMPGWVVFSPRFFAHVAFGMMLAPYLRRLGPRTGLVALAAVVVCYLVAEKIMFPSQWRVGDRLAELPLTVVLLSFLPALDTIPGVGAALSWLGRHSFGLYLGQLLTHNGFLFAFGGECSLYACSGGLFDSFNLWVYTGILAVGSLTFLGVGHAILWINDLLREGGAPLPDLTS